MNSKVNSRRCSFCGKTEDGVCKLMSSPSDRSPRSYICNECVSVCVTIIEDAKRESELPADDIDSSGQFISHPLAPSLLVATERWALRHLRGLAASDELNEVRNLAAKMLSETGLNADEPVRALS